MGEPAPRQAAALPVSGTGAVSVVQPAAPVRRVRGWSPAARTPGSDAVAERVRLPGAVGTSRRPARGPARARRGRRRRDPKDAAALERAVSGRRSLSARSSGGGGPQRRPRRPWDPWDSVGRRANSAADTRGPSPRRSGVRAALRSGATVAGWAGVCAPPLVREADAVCAKPLGRANEIELHASDRIGRPFRRGRPGPEPGGTSPGAASGAGFGRAADRTETGGRYGRNAQPSAVPGRRTGQRCRSPTAGRGGGAPMGRPSTPEVSHATGTGPARWDCAARWSILSGGTQEIVRRTE